GSDPSGGVGIQGDPKTLAAHRVYGMAVIPAITVQNTLGRRRVQPLPAGLLGPPLTARPPDMVPDTTEVATAGAAPASVVVATVRVVASVLLKHRDARAAGLPDWHIVLDPVMSATQGGALLDVEGVTALRESLLPIATVVTPNTLEAERLTNMRVRSIAEAR